MSGERTTKEMSLWGKFWAGNGAGSEGDKNKMESPGSYQHLWEAVRALSPWAHPHCILHSSCFNSSPPSSGL